MEDLTKYILEFQDKKKVEKLTDQEKFNKLLVNSLSHLVHVRSNGSKIFKIAPELNDTYMQLFMYLNRDLEVENIKNHVTIQPWKLNKGVFLIGDFGRGKTLLLDTIFLKREPLKIKGNYCTAFELSEHYVKDNNKFKQLTNGENSLFLDEVGDEPKETLNYGNAENTTYRAMKLFFDKVEKQKEKQRLFATSNLGKNELVERYDERIWSRIVGGCNIIVFGKGVNDFRKTN